MKEFIEKLIERLDEIEEHCLDMLNWQGQTAIVEAKDIVNQLAEEYNGGWIPCSEKEEPNEYGRYIVYVQHYSNKDLYDLTIVDWFGEWKINYDWNILAWQHLPEPYKPEGE